MAANPVSENLTSWQPDHTTNDSNNPTGSSPAGVGDSQDLSGNLRLLKSVIRAVAAHVGWERWLGVKNLAASGNIAFSFSSGTVFTVNDNFTSSGRDVAFLGQRVRATLAGPTYIYGTISAAPSWSSPNTTITVTWDSGSLSNPITEIEFADPLRNIQGLHTGSSGQFLRHNGTLWVPAALVFGDLPDIATAAQYRANTASKILTTDQVWSAAGIVALTDAATIAVDMSTGFNFSVTLGGNRTLGNPTNTKVGQSGVFIFTQDGTGGRTLTFASNYKKAASASFTLSTAPGAKDIIGYFVQDSTNIILTGIVSGVA